MKNIIDNLKRIAKTKSARITLVWVMAAAILTLAFFFAPGTQPVAELVTFDDGSVSTTISETDQLSEVRADMNEVDDVGANVSLSSDDVTASTGAIDDNDDEHIPSAGDRGGSTVLENNANGSDGVGLDNNGTENSGSDSDGSASINTGSDSSENSSDENSGVASDGRAQQTPAPQSTPSPTPQPAPLTVTITITCHTILNNMDMISRDGLEYVIPADGIILGTTTVVFEEGESVFDVLLRTTRALGIHMSHRWTPAHNSAYVAGIHNIFEFDVGSLSGWMYRVNGVFPNFGASRYILSDGDVIEWIYTVDLGRDIGGGNW